MSKKGQISIFVIVGIVLLVLIVGGTVIYNQLADTTGDVLTGISESVPDEVLPLKRFADSCISDILLEGLKKSGANGGEIYSREFRQYNFFNPADADGVEFFPGGDLLVPYYVHTTGELDCQSGCNKEIKIPALEGQEPETIQFQLERFIAERIDECFPRQFEAVTLEAQGAPEVSVTFGAADTNALVNFPIKIITPNSEHTVSEFTATQKVPFRSVYSKAVEMSALIHESDIFSKATVAWITMYGDMDNDLLPPLAGTDLEFVSTLVWTEERVTEGIRNILVKNVPLFTVESSRNYHPVESESVFSDVYNNYILPGEGFQDYNVEFLYNDWNPYVTLNDGEKVIRPESASVSWFPFFGINRVRTMYSVSYPIVTTITDPEALDGDGFVFNFATEANVRNNDVIGDSYQAFDFSIFDEIDNGKSLLCDIQNSEPVSFNLVDGLTGEPLEEVFITQFCGEETCAIAQVDGGFNAPLSVCAGGSVQILKPNYETIDLRIDPNIDGRIDLGTIALEPYRSKNVSVKRRTWAKNTQTGKWFLRGGTQSIDNKETIILSLERVEAQATRSEIEKQPFSTFAVIENGEIGTMPRILPGIYEGSLISTSDLSGNPLRILPDERCEDILGGLDEECYDVPEETLELSQLQGGGAEYNQNTTLIAITKSALDGSDTIEFFEFFSDLEAVPEIERKIEDLGAIGKYQELSINNSELLTPVFR